MSNEKLISNFTTYYVFASSLLLLPFYRYVLNIDHRLEDIPSSTMLELSLPRDTTHS